MSVKISPLDWDKDLMPRDPELFDGVQKFAEREFGGLQGGLLKYNRVFAASNQENKVIGLAAIVNRLDVPMFHIESPDMASRPAIRDSLLASDLLYTRLCHYIEDVGGKGLETFVYVNPEVRDRWSEFLKRIGAKESHRYVVVP